MKKRKKNQLWYNAYDKEVGGILLESREAALRLAGPRMIAHGGVRWVDLYSDTRTAVL